MEEKIISEELYNIAKENNYPLNFITVGNINDVPTNIPTHSQLQLWLWETYTIHVSVIPIKRMKESNIYFYFKIIDFRGIDYNEEVIYEHQYNNSLEEYTTQYQAWDEGLKQAINLINYVSRI